MLWCSPTGWFSTSWVISSAALSTFCSKTLGQKAGLLSQETDATEPFQIFSGHPAEGDCWGASCESCVAVFEIRYLVPKRRKQIKLSWHEISWDPLEPSKVSQNNSNQFSSENHASSNVCLKLIYEICLCMVWYGMERNVMKCSSIESNFMWCNAMKCNLTWCNAV